MGVNARGAGFSWLGEALMQLAAQNRMGKQRQAALAGDERRYNAGLQRDNERFQWQKERAEAADKTEAERLKAAAAETQRKNWLEGIKSGFAPVGSGPGGMPIMRRDPNLDWDVQEKVAIAKATPPTPHELPRPLAPQLQETEGGFAVFDPNNRSLTALGGGLKPRPRASEQVDPVKAAIAARIAAAGDSTGGDTQGASGRGLLGRLGGLFHGREPAVAETPAPAKDWKARATELKAAGKTPQEIVATLRAEGLVK